jgi:hypothetical protein
MDAVFSGVGAAFFVIGDDGLSGFLRRPGVKRVAVTNVDVRRHSPVRRAGRSTIFVASGLNERGEQGEIVGHHRCPDIRVEVREPPPGATPQPECALQA